MEGYFNLAKAAALMSTHPKIQVGAVIVNKKPISVGANLYKTHPVFANLKDGKYSIHAEVKAILSCPRSKLYGSEIWVYREKADGTPALAKPCRNCQKILIEAGIRRVYYTTNDNFELMDLY